MCTSSVLDNRLRGVGIDFSLYICVCSIWVKYYSLHNNNNKCAETMTQRAEDGIRSKRNNCQRVGLLLELLAGAWGGVAEEESGECFGCECCCCANTWVTLLQTVDDDNCCYIVVVWFSVAYYHHYSYLSISTEEFPLITINRVQGVFLSMSSDMACCAVSC